MWRPQVLEVAALGCSSVGWTLVALTLALEGWRSVYVGGKGGNWMIKGSWYWSSLWRDCVTDTSSVTNCVELEALWAATPFVQAVRALLMIALALGLIAMLLCFLGMDCTYIGGELKTKHRTLFAGVAFHFIGGVSALSAYSLYTNRVARMAFAPVADRTVIRYGIGAPIFVGLVGCFLITLAAGLYATSAILSRKKRVTVLRSSVGRRSASKSLYTSTYYDPSGKSYSVGISRTAKTSDEKLSTRDTFV
ncbi:hypothetical protein DNTS_003329 [Danionella cerebrum]|uniref:Claudin n=1 Tax=Danionella cerebrum TaxID=2873325 RepID=A0A553QNW0_9TELE|nr:hypothetical protein DNTS_003329 [Danionella translucida]TRY91665.1 hypothetical protein DNTS_003329 [Danionella translucida]